MSKEKNEVILNEFEQALSLITSGNFTAHKNNWKYDYAVQRIQLGRAKLSAVQEAKIRTKLIDECIGGKAFTTSVMGADTSLDIASRFVLGKKEADSKARSKTKVTDRKSLVDEIGLK